MPYSGRVICEYPKVYLEPVPEVYRNLADACSFLNQPLSNLYPLLKGKSLQEWQIINNITYQLSYISRIYQIISTVAQKIQNKDSLTEDDKRFLLSPIYKSENTGCDIGTNFNGWYLSLMYKEHYSLDHAQRSKSVVADIFTQPFDESGAEVGKVMHIGTGPFTMAVIVVRDKNGCEQAYCGPVYSYREFMTGGYKRLTDEEWRSTMTLEAMPAPRWTNLYLAGAKGEERTGEKQTYITSVEERKPAAATGEKLAVAVTPNPVSAGSVVILTIPEGCSHSATRVELTAADGKAVAVLAEEILPAGTFVLPFRPEEFGLADGLYFVSVKCGSNSTSASLVLTRRQ